MPSAYSFAKMYDIQALVISLPAMICTVLLLFLSESRALMRCGTYIKQVLEPHIESSPKVGWEAWLSEAPKGELDRRSVDKFLVVFFYILFAFYYAASVHLATDTAKNLFGVTGFAVTLGVYIAIGIIFIALLFISFRASTTTQK